MKAKTFRCNEYPTYVFHALDGGGGAQTKKFKVTIMRGLDSTWIVDLLVGERLTLIPALKVTNTTAAAANISQESQKRKREGFDAGESYYLKEEDYFLCKIMTIDQSTNGRRSDIAVQAL
jgi:hypothetical protein